MEDINQQAAAKAGIKQKTINGKIYSVKLLPATLGMTISSRIMKAMGPAIGVVVDSKDEIYLPGEQSFYTDIAVAVVAQLDELSLEMTVQELLGGLSCDGHAVDFDRHFAGNYGSLIAVVEYALQENFGNFFTDYLRAKGLEIHTLRDLMKPKEETPEPSKDE